MELQYIRAKREKKTFFIECFPSERIEKIKNMLQEFLSVPDPNDIKLYTLDNRRRWTPYQLIDERSTVHDQDLKNDCIIKILLKKPGPFGQAPDWEPLEEEAEKQSAEQPKA